MPFISIVLFVLVYLLGYWMIGLILKKHADSIVNKSSLKTSLIILVVCDTVNEVSGTWRTDRKPSTELGLLVHIMVDDIEATIKAVIDNGGKIVQPVGMEAPEITARFSDPTGNILGLFQQ